MNSTLVVPRESVLASPSTAVKPVIRPRHFPKAKKDRITSIDSMRAVANLAVITGHWFSFLGPSGNASYQLAFLFLGNLSNVTAPFFFIVSGFFLHRSVKSGKKLSSAFSRLYSRIMVIYLFWMALYTFAPIFGLRSIFQGDFVRIHEQTVLVFSQIGENFLTFMMTSNTPHLWFLPALIIANGLMILMLNAKMEKWLLPIGTLAYIVFIMKVPYEIIFGASALPLEWIRILPAFFFVTIGYCLNSEKFRSKAKLGLALLVAGFFLKIVERLFLVNILSSSNDFCFLISTPVISAGAFLFAISCPEWGKGTILPVIGKYSLGIYAAHVFIQYRLFDSDIFSPAMKFTAPFYVHIVGIGLIYALSLMFIYLASRWRRLKSFII